MIPTTPTSPAPAVIFVRDRLTWLTYLMLGIFNYVQSSLGPVMPFLRSELDLSFTMGGLHSTVFALGAVAVGLLGDTLLRALGRHTVFWGSALGMVLFALVFIASPVVAMTIATAGAMGLCASLIILTVNAVLSDHHGTLRTVALSEANILASLGGALVPLAVGFSQQTLGTWRPALVVPLLLVLALALVFRREELPRMPIDASEDGTASRTRRLPLAFWVYWLVLFCAIAVEWCLIIWSADFLLDTTAISPGWAATAVSLFLVGQVIGRFVASRLAHHISAETLLLGAVLVALLGMPLFWLVPLLPVKIIGLLIAGIGVGNFFPLGLSAALGTAPQQSDRVSARISIAAGLGISGMPLLLGWVADQAGIAAAFAVAAVLLTLTLLLTLLGRRMQPVAAG
jgi:fucose permease